MAFSAAFLERISAYPEPVQEALKTPLDEASLRSYMRVLRGPGALSPDEIDKVLANPPVADAFLGRQLVSRAFAARLVALRKLLPRATPDDIAGVLEDLIGPLADHDAPFLYKLREITAGGEAPNDEIALLAVLVEMTRRLQGFAGEADTLILEEIGRAGAGHPVPMLPYLLSALGGVPVLSNSPLTPGLPIPAGARFVRGLLDPHAPPELSPDARDTLKFIDRDLGRGDGTVALHRARPIRVVLEDGQGPEIPSFWTQMQSRGLVGQVLHRSALVDRTAHQKDTPTASLYLPAGQEVSPLLLAYLRVQGDDQASLDLRRPGASLRPSWSQRIEGYRDTSTTATLGRYRAGPDATGTTATLEIASAGSRAADHALPEPDAGAAYAILVRLDDSIDTSVFLNADRCITVDGLAALPDRFADAPAVIRQKPVILLGRHTPRHEDYLVNAAQSFWAFGGHYTVTPAQIGYDGDAMRLRALPASGESLSHLALADLCTLPLDLALGLARDPVTRDRIVFLPETLIVQTPGNIPLTAEAILALNRALGGLDIAPRRQDALFLEGEVHADRLAALSPVRHWPIAHLIRQPARRQSRLDGLLRRFAGHPDAATADAILHMAGRMRLGTANAAALDRFTLQLSALPRILEDLEDASLEALLTQARQTASADAIAANLAISARTLCRKNTGLIIPLFELLACALDDSSLNATLIYTAADNALPRRAMFRIGECMRRYASSGVLLQHLVYLKETESTLLADPRFLKYFERLLTEAQPAALEARLGTETLAMMAGTREFRDLFQRALLARDKTRLLELLSEPEHARHVDFTKWMDTLRAFSNELRDMALPIGRSTLTQTSSLHANRLMGVIFSDTKVLGEMAAEGYLDDMSDLSLVAQNILGNNQPLNRMLSERCAETGISPMEIHGSTVTEVFAHAARSVPKSKRIEGPRVSVIMSAFNADPALLELSLDSVLAQTHADLEVFVVDDASQQENSATIRAICEARKHVSYRRLEVNSGPYIGRNKVLEAASGEFIAIQDADDWSHPDRFATQVAALSENPLLQLVTCPHMRIDRAGKVQLEAEFTILGDGPMTSMFRRSVFDTVGPFAAIRSRGDVEMRERIRGYYGSHAMTELPQPMMLCFADSATLSQRTKQANYERLQLFRGNVSMRRHLQSARRAGVPLAGQPGILVPRALRPTTNPEG